MPSSPTRRDTQLTSRLQGFGTTIFSEMTSLAIQHDAVNLGQGFPDQDPPREVVAAAHAALDAGHHQYAPGPGVAVLREAIAAHQQRFHGLAYDPDTEVTVTFGATEGLAATLLACCEVGTEVVVLDPSYDAYAAVIAMAGAVERRVALVPPAPDDRTAGWRLDHDRFAAAVGPRTRAVLINSPHNPTGTVLGPEDLAAIAEVCIANDLIAITDEVYEHLVYDATHLPLATWPGMRERTVTVSSAGKTFSATGWKVGWACAPPGLTTALRTTKQFLSFAGATPLQHAVAHGLWMSEEVFAGVATTHRRRRDLLHQGLADLGLPVLASAATYFLVADVSSLGWERGEDFCRWAPGAIGVAAVPVSAFVRDRPEIDPLVRFAFCKQEPVLEEGVRRLGAGVAS